MDVPLTAYQLLRHSPVPVDVAAAQLPQHTHAISANPALRRQPRIAAALVDTYVVHGSGLARDDRIAGEVIAAAGDPVADLEHWEMYLTAHPGVAVELAGIAGIDPSWGELLRTVIDTRDTRPSHRRALAEAFATNPALGGLDGTHWRHSDLAHRAAVGPDDVTLDDAVTHTVTVAGFAAWVHLARRRSSDVLAVLTRRGDGLVHHVTVGAAAAVIARHCPRIAGDAAPIADHYHRQLAGVVAATWRNSGRTAIGLLRSHVEGDPGILDADVADLVDGPRTGLWAPTTPADPPDAERPDDVATVAAVCGTSPARWRLALELADTLCGDDIAAVIAAT